ncbi:hypothetical protein IWQ61_003047 [Dispira simplex]|nr:hypothetical protein IWQ61_003047 [Dispira simplex]
MISSTGKKRTKRNIRRKSVPATFQGITESPETPTVKRSAREESAHRNAIRSESNNPSSQLYPRRVSGPALIPHHNDSPIPAATRTPGKPLPDDTYDSDQELAPSLGDITTTTITMNSPIILPTPVRLGKFTSEMDTVQLDTPLRGILNYRDPVTPHDVTRERRKQIRKSLNRRVSFAATAHVRLFEKEQDEWNSGSSFSDGNPSFDASLMGSSLSQDTLEPPVSVAPTNRFQLPDLATTAGSQLEDDFSLNLSLDTSQLLPPCSVESPVARSSNDEKVVRVGLFGPLASAYPQAVDPHVPVELDEDSASSMSLVSNGSMGSPVWNPVSYYPDDDSLDGLASGEDEDMSLVTDIIPIDPVTYSVPSSVQERPIASPTQTIPQDATMDITECVGGIRGPNTLAVGPVVSSTTAKTFTNIPRASPNVDLTSSLTMDMTECVGGIQPSDSPSSTQPVPDTPLAISSPVGQGDVATLEYTMEMTECVGGIQPVDTPGTAQPVTTTPLSAPSSVGQDDLTILDFTMDMTQCVGGIVTTPISTTMTSTTPAQQDTNPVLLPPQSPTIASIPSPSLSTPRGPSGPTDDTEVVTMDLTTCLLQTIPATPHRTTSLSPSLLVIPDRENSATALEEQVDITECLGNIQSTIPLRQDSSPHPSPRIVVPTSPSIVSTPITRKGDSDGKKDTPFTKTLSSPSPIHLSLHSPAPITPQRTSRGTKRSLPVTTPADQKTPTTPVLPAKKQHRSVRRSLGESFISPPQRAERLTAKELLRRRTVTASVSSQTPSPSSRLRGNVTPDSPAQVASPEPAVTLLPDDSPQITPRSSRRTSRRRSSLMSAINSQSPLTPSNKRNSQASSLVSPVSNSPPQMSTGDDAAHTPDKSTPSKAALGTPSAVTPLFPHNRLQTTAENSPVSSHRGSLVGLMHSIKSPTVTVYPVDSAPITTAPPVQLATEIPFDIPSDEIPLPDPVTFVEFLELTGIQFMDDLYPTVIPRPVARNNTTPERSSLHDAAKASVALFPEWELYQFLCGELEQYIDKGQQAVAKSEGTFRVNNPSSILDYLLAPGYERLHLELDFKLLKEHARLQSKKIWYTWREMLLQPVLKSYKQSLQSLRDDQQTIRGFKESVQDSLPILRRYQDKLRQQIQAVKDRKLTLQKCDQEELQGLREAIREQSQVLTSCEDEFMRLQREQQDKAQRLEDLKRRKAELKQGITQARETLAQNTFYTIANLQERKERLDTLCSLHDVQLLELTPTRSHWCFRQRLLLTMDRTTTPTLNLALATPDALMMTKEGKTNTVRSLGETQAVWARMLQDIETRVNIITTHRSVYERVQSLLDAWHHLDELQRDVAKVQVRSPTVLSYVSETQSLLIKVLFSHYGSDCRFYISFWLRSPVITYPPQNLEWDLENVYGNTSLTMLKDCIMTTGPWPPGTFYPLANACRQVHTMLESLPITKY